MIKGKGKVSPRTGQQLFHWQHSTLWCQYFGVSVTNPNFIGGCVYEGPCKIRSFKYIEYSKNQNGEFEMIVEFPFPVVGVVGDFRKRWVVLPYDIIFDVDTDEVKKAILKERKRAASVLVGWGERALAMEKIYE